MGYKTPARRATTERRTLTRSLTPPTPPASCEEVIEIALALRSRVNLGEKQLYRLVGVGLSNFEQGEEQLPGLKLFEEE